MQDTRQQILDYLRERREASVRDLGDHLGLTATGVRQHVTILERAGLVRSREQRGRVGRPALLYQLSDSGEAEYPKQYHTLASALLESLSAGADDAELRAALDEVGARLAAPVASELADAPAEERIEAACRALGAQQVVADWERDGDAFLLRERTCPYPEVAALSPAACAVDVSYISALTGLDATLVECRTNGDGCCSFRLTAPAGTAAPR
jgi:DeoR family transcriptional regulator, suf operon transcriptional repressor